MCGICGFTGATATDAPTIKAMCDVMAHRGPDGEGQYLDDGIALGHRRLSLIDLEGGMQPMVRATGEHSSTVTSPARNAAEAGGASPADKAPANTEAKTEAEADAETDSAQAKPAFAQGDFAIVFNGEIYNYQDLRAELVAQGWSFKTNSDTEVLLVGYLAWGEQVLDRLRGMFAFAIWDKKARELFCARDFFGIKPFYYTVQENERGKQFVFASEIKSILEHPAYKRELNEAALEQYLCFQFSALDETFFKGVFKLPAAHCVRVHADGSLEMRRYWRPEYHFDETRTEAETAQAIDDAMRESVRYHNVADVEVGSFLSSGIDSSYMAACLAKENPDIKTFTVGFECYKNASENNACGAGGKTMRDEISWAAELADELHIENSSKHITEAEYWEVLPRVQWHMDEPSADPSAVALYFVDQIAAEKVKAVLSGEGADEFFGGYRIYQAPFASKKLSWAPKGLLRSLSKTARALGIRGANYLERASETVEDWYYTNANGVAFSPEERERLRAGKRSSDGKSNVTSDAATSAAAESAPASTVSAAGFAVKSAPGRIPTPQELTAPAYAEVASQDETTRMQYVDLFFWLVGDILLKTDKMSMAHSLESRVPFLDKEVFAIAATIPTRLKANEQQTKLTLREASECAIPHDWAQKEKLGFPVPVVNWLREDRYYNQVKESFTSETAEKFFNTNELVRLLDEHRAGADRSRKIWIVYMFLVWYKVFFEQNA